MESIVTVERLENSLRRLATLLEQQRQVIQALERKLDKLALWNKDEAPG